MSKFFDHFDEQRMIAVVSWEDDDGDEIETEFAIKFCVCQRCRGKGSHCNPSIDGNGLTREDFAEDPDFAEDYFRGVYDLPCHECDGRRVVPEMASDPDKLEGEQAEAYRFACDRIRGRAEDARTMRMESGDWR